MKRGASGFSLLVAVDKPCGMTSHDVVNRCRSVFGEKRVGHTGTLDPLATGVLPVCVGPAARLDRFMTSHDKRYRVDIAFGCETTTDDSQGEPTVREKVPSYLYDEDFAIERCSKLVGAHQQVPPQYSAVKVKGKKAYEIARSGGEIELEPRTVEIFEAVFRSLGEGSADAPLTWTVDLFVSKGTYIRSLVRDLGRSLMCPAHVAGLRRMQAGRIEAQHCVSLETLSSMGAEAALDPVRVLGLRFAFADAVAQRVDCGAALPAPSLALNEPLPMVGPETHVSCTSCVRASDAAPLDGELSCVVVSNTLKAIYSYDEAASLWKPACVFSTGVMRS